MHHNLFVISKLILLATFSMTASCSHSFNSNSEIGEFSFERVGDSIALYTDSSLTGDCILATASDGVLKSLQDIEVGRAEFRYRKTKYPVFVPTYINNQIAYDRPANVHGKLVERLCVSEHLFWIEEIKLR